MSIRSPPILSSQPPVRPEAARGLPRWVSKPGHILPALEAPLAPRLLSLRKQFKDIVVSLDFRFPLISRILQINLILAIIATRGDF